MTRQRPRQRGQRHIADRIVYGPEVRAVEQVEAFGDEFHMAALAGAETERS